MRGPIHADFIFADDNKDAMHRRPGIAYGQACLERAGWLIALLLAMCAPAMAVITPAEANGTEGMYTITVRGYWSGQGTAVVHAASVDITADVKTDSGATGTLVVQGAALKNGHFVGTGTVMGVSLQIEGRVDAADLTSPTTAPATQRRRGHNNKHHGPDQAVVTNARIGATFLASSGHAGRVAGGKN